MDLFRSRVNKTPDGIAMRAKIDGSWRGSTWAEFDKRARAIAAGLIDAGVEVGDRVVVLANTRAEWFECDVGVLMSGAVTVPIYPSNTPEQCEYIINDCGGKLIVVEDPHQLEKLYDPEVIDKLKHIGKVVYMSDQATMAKPDHKGRKQLSMDEAIPDGADRSWLESLDDLIARGTAWLANNEADLDKIADNLDPEQAMTMVYTSGTTGPPKGVVITHANIVFETGALSQVLYFGEEDEQLLFLPLAHIFAKILEWSAIAQGATTAFAEGVPQLIDNMKEVKPTYMGAVPRVYEKAYVKIQANLQATIEGGGPKAMMAKWALKQGQRRARQQQAGRGGGGFRVWLADKLVFSKVQATFGGNLRFFISGGAPLAREIADFFHSAGVLILEGYGLTETTAATHLNTLDRYKFGTVGPALPGVEVEIAKDGEILVRGPNVMKEYFNKPEKTAEVINDQGWFHTGDIGVIENGMLRITDRKKDIIVTAGGKNVAPQNIENSLKALCPYISQVMVYGDKRKFLSALVTLNEEELVPWANKRGIEATTLRELSEDPAVQKMVADNIAKLNEDLASYETIKKYEILSVDFTQETGELTPTLKVKRKFCTEKFQDKLDAFYADLPQSSL